MNVLPALTEVGTNAEGGKHKAWKKCVWPDLAGKTEETVITPTQKVKEVPPFLLRLEVGEVGTVGFAQGGGVAVLELEIATPYLCSSFFK